VAFLATSLRSLEKARAFGLTPVNKLEGVIPSGAFFSGERDLARNSTAAGVGWPCPFCADERGSRWIGWPLWLAGQCGAGTEMLARKSTVPANQLDVFHV
jgi:hypothetical protein